MFRINDYMSRLNDPMFETIFIQKESLIIPLKKLYFMDPYSRITQVILPQNEEINDLMVFEVIYYIMNNMV